VERSIRSLAGGESGQTAPEARADRRKVLLGGGAAVALIAGGAVIWTRGNRDSAPPEVELLMQKGVDALQSDDSAIIAQSIPLLTEATDAAPRYATAWGALALAYAVVRFNVPLAQRGAYAARCRSAARTALDLKPNEGRALAALRLLDPVYGHWLGAEHDDRAALSRQPKLPILLAILADLLSDVGRWREALKYQLQMDRSRYLLPAADRDLVNILWATGNIQGADDAIAQAIERWPQHRSVWQTRTRFLMYTGRANEALALLQDSSARPEGLAQDYLDSMEATAEAITGRLNPAIAVERNLASLSTTPARALLIAQCCVALSATNVALAILEGYYFGTGEWARVAPLAGDEDRMTAPLFQPPMKPLWNDPRFIRLLSRTGLEEYWRRSKTRPDFRRNS
jgi:tetratricopeptide (TPR) repeat protein